jgi:hypothetical protein
MMFESYMAYGIKLNFVVSQKFSLHHDRTVSDGQ